MPKLTIELVPGSCWYKNVRSEVTGAVWDKIRKAVAKAANSHCEICGGVGPKWPVECHEVWEYDDEACIQKLVRLIALCPACHEVKHIGRAGSMGRGEIARKHLAKVNEWSDQEALDYVAESFGIWVERSKKTWTLDISALDRYK